MWSVRVVPLDDSKRISSIWFNNSFKVDPPNGVLVSSEEQKTYELKTATNNGNGNYTIQLELLPGESHVGLNVLSGKFSLFVDVVLTGGIINNANNAIIKVRKMLRQISRPKNW